MNRQRAQNGPPRAIKLSLRSILREEFRNDFIAHVNLWCHEATAISVLGSLLFLFVTNKAFDDDDQEFFHGNGNEIIKWCFESVLRGKTDALPLAFRQIVEETIPNFQSIVFSHALQLFMSEWKIEEPQFCEYFEREWVQKHPNWYAAANLRAPNTNNGVEGYNSSIKAIHTLRQRLVLTMFKETLCKMLRYKSAMYIREKEAKVFYSEPKISRDDWSKAVEYARDPDTKRRIFMHNHLYYILSCTHCGHVEAESSMSD